MLATNTNSPLGTPSIPSLYSAIFQQTPIAFEIYDKNGLLVDANPACLKLFGVSCLSDIKKFPLFDDPNVSHEVKDQLLHGETVTYATDFSFDAVKAHGFYPTQRSGNMEISVKINPICDTKRVLTGYLCVISDMTEIKSTMNSLVESEQRYKSAFYDHTAVKLIIDSDSGNIIDANKAAVRFYGWSADQLNCMRIQDINTLTNEDLFKEMQNARNDNRTFFRFQHRLANGSVRDVEVFSSKMHMRGKELLHSIVHDVTDKKLAEEKQKALAEMLDIAPSSITIHDTEGNFLFSNQKTGEFHGYTRDEFKRINLHDLDVPESETLLAERFSIIENVGEARFNVSHYRKDGTSFPLEVYAKKIAWEGKPAILSIATDITERVLAEEKIKSQNALFSMITQTSPVGIVSVDKTGSITYANARAEEILGLGKKEITSLTYDAPLWNHINSDGTPFPDEKQPFNIVKATMSTAYDIQHGILRPDGKVVLLSINAIPMKDMHDNFDGMLATIEDITERKKAENKLQESEEKYRAAFMTSPDSVNINRLDGLYVDINEGFTGITGYMRKDVIGKLSSEINIWSIPEDREKLVKGLREKGKVENLESVFKNKDGSLKTGLMSARVVTLNDKPHILSVTRDITDRKKTEEALAVEKERLSVTLQSIGDGVITTDTKGNIVLLNKVAEEMTGWLSAEAAGRPLREVFNIINEITREKCEDPVERVLTTGEIVELANHTALVARDNREIIIADSAAPIKATNGETIGIVLVFRDMTEKKKLETALEVSSKLESLGILAGGIAHDFNNLLGGIYGYIDLASESSNNVEVTQYLSKTMTTIDRARDLTKQLLTFAKGGAPVQKIAPLFPFLQETAQFALSGSKISCDFDVQQDLWNSNYDSNQIGQVIDNLIINAQQAMPIGGTITVSARNIVLAEKEHPVLEKGDYVRIAVKDTGVGIPKGLLSKIFDPFFTTKTKGHGLGLATCYSIINRHGGCLNVYSEQGKGSVFNAYLPAAKGSASETHKKTTMQHKGSGIFLVMDDEKVMQETISNMLSSFGYTVVCKNNGKDAVDYVVSELNAKLVLSGMIFDLTVPGGMGGKDAVAQIRKVHTKIPVFVASGYADDPVMKNPEEYGFTASICKPFIKSELLEILVKHIKTEN